MKHHGMEMYSGVQLKPTKSLAWQYKEVKSQLHSMDALRTGRSRNPNGTGRGGLNRQYPLLLWGIEKSVVYTNF